MKILKLLSKFYFIFVFSFFFITNLEAEDKPIDIWNIDKTQVEDNNSQLPSNIEIEENENSQNKINIFGMQSEKELNTIELENTLNLKNLKIIGLYDPEDYGLDINMWINSNGDQLKNIFSKIEKIQLSKDAQEIMNISMLTNAYHPNINISEEEFLKYKSNWLIKNSNLDLCNTKEAGLIQTLSLLPVSYPGQSILTEDIGIIHGIDNCKCGKLGKYFSVLGRVPDSELRGCSDVN